MGLQNFGWNINNGLTPLEIVFISLFVTFLISLILLTVAFWFYRQQLKKIAKIDQNIEIINRYPLEEAINRLAKINERNNKQFNQFYRLMRIKYLTILTETFKAATNQFLNGLENHEFTKLNYRAIKKLALIDESIDKAKVEFDTLHNLINDFFSYEYVLRDMVIDLKRQVNLIKKNYEQLTNANQYKFPEKVFYEYLGYIHKFVNLIHNYLVLGDYQTAFEKLAKILTWTLKVNEEITLYPKIRSFLTDDLSQELQQIEKDWTSGSLTLNRAKNRFKFLKERTFKESKLAFDAINVLDFNRTKLVIKKIQTEIYDFKSELVYEEEIKTFFKFRGNEIKVTIEQINQWVKKLREEYSPHFKKAEKAIYDTLLKPSERIKQSLANLNEFEERELEDLKDSLYADLVKIDESIYLLNLVKTAESQTEEKFLTYLALSFEIKANLIVISNVLKDARIWMVPNTYLTFSKEFEIMFKELNKDEVSNLQQFIVKYNDQDQKTELIDRLNKLKNYSYKLKSMIVYEYEVYCLTTALLPILEFGQKESKIQYIYKEMVNLIDTKNYEQAIDQFMNQLSTVYYQL